MGSFNWHDEETGWDVVEETVENGPPRNNGGQSRPFRVWMLLLLILIMGFVAWGVFWRVNSVEDELEEKVLESWSVILVSEKNQDIELLTNQLSGRNIDWINVQQRLAEDQKLSNRAAILPGLKKVGALDTNPEIVFLPDLTEATISHKVTYVDKRGREITLIQDEIFRLGQDRWLLSPPGPLHWATQSGSAEDVELKRYSNRFAYFAVAADIELVAKIVNLFEDRLDTLCTEGFFGACKTEQTPQIEISFIPEMRKQMLEEQLSIDPFDLSVTFPTPSIIGRPVNDEDLQLLAEAYGHVFFERYLIVLMDHRKVNSGPMAEAIVNFALAQSGGVPPLTPADYQRVWLEIEDVEIAFNQNRVVGEGTGNIRQFMDIPVQSTFRLMVEYRMQEVGLTPQGLLDQQLSVENAPFFPEELLRPDEWDDFSQFVETRAALATTPERENAASAD